MLSNAPIKESFCASCNVPPDPHHLAQGTLECIGKKGVNVFLWQIVLLDFACNSAFIYCRCMWVCFLLWFCVVHVRVWMCNQTPLLHRLSHVRVCQYKVCSSDSFKKINPLANKATRGARSHLSWVQLAGGEEERRRGGEEERRRGGEAVTHTEREQVES